jgi:hypothetical protein
MAVLSSTPTVPRNLGLGSVLALAAWIAALFAPCAEVVEAGQFTPPHVDALHGYRLAAFGWIGSLGLSIAWYANIPFLYCVWKLLRGEAPSLKVSLIAFCLALTSLLPHISYSAVDGRHLAHFSGPAVWLWLMAFAINLVLAKLCTPRK